MVVDVGGVQLQETHLAAAAAVVALLVFVLMKPGASAKEDKPPQSGGKKKQDAGKKKEKAQPKKQPKEAKKDTNGAVEKKPQEPKKKEEPKKATPKVAPAPDPESPKGKKGKKAAAKAAKELEEAQKKEAEEGWVVAETIQSKKQKKKNQELLANQQANIGKTAAPAAKTEAPKQAAAPATKGTAFVKPLGFDFAKDAEETLRRTEQVIADQELDAKQRAKRKQEGLPEVPVDEQLPRKKIPLPREKTGIIVGPGGQTIALLKEKTGASRIDTAGGVCLIEALEQESVDACAKAVQDLINKGYSELQYEDFSEQFVSTVPSNFAELIGPKGAIVRKIKEELGVEIQFPPSPPKGQGKGVPEKKLKIAIAGDKANVIAAKDVMNEILTVHHSELTHPDEIHREVDVKPQHYAFIIGSRGSELKHIQSNYKVKVYIPRGEEEAPVLVVGLDSNVDRAIKHIEKTCETAANRVTGVAGRGDGEGGDDWWDNDDEWEPWMADYVIRRR